MKKYLIILMIILITIASSNFTLAFSIDPNNPEQYVVTKEEAKKLSGLINENRSLKEEVAVLRELVKSLEKEIELKDENIVMLEDKVFEIEKHNQEITTAYDTSLEKANQTIQVLEDTVDAQDEVIKAESGMDLQETFTIMVYLYAGYELFK